MSCLVTEGGNCLMNTFREDSPTGRELLDVVLQTDSASQSTSKSESSSYSIENENYMVLTSCSVWQMSLMCVSPLKTTFKGP